MEWPQARINATRQKHNAPISITFWQRRDDRNDSTFRLDECRSMRVLLAGRIAETRYFRRRQSAEHYRHNPLDTSTYEAARP